MLNFLSGCLVFTETVENVFFFTVSHSLYKPLLKFDRNQLNSLRSKPVLDENYFILFLTMNLKMLKNSIDEFGSCFADYQ